MRHGWVYIYESPPASERFEELVDHFALDGISLTNPGTGRAISLSPIGEQILTTREGILKELTERKEVPFNFYLDSTTNLFCSIDKLNDKVLREGYSLDGKTEQESERVIKSLTDLFCKRAENRVAFGLVVDKYAGLHRDFHWDDFFVGDTPVPPEWPLLLGFSKSFGKLSVVPDRLFVREEANNHILFRRVEN